jgi:hypothetical protein
MDLQKQVLSLPMSLGIDTENAAPLIDNQRFAFLSNCVFNKDNNGQLHKRSGHNPLLRTLQGGGMLPAAQLLAIFNEETCAVAGGALYGYSTQAQNWANRGSLPMVQEVETNIAAGAFSVQNPDAVILNGMAYYAYEMNGNSWVKVVDDSNKSIKATIKLFGGSVPNYTPKLVSNGTNVIALSTTALGVMWATTINATTYAATFSSVLGITLDVVANEGCFDAAVLSGTLYVAFIHSSGVYIYSYSASTLANIATANPGLAGTTGAVAPAPISLSTAGTSIVLTWQFAQNAPANAGKFQTVAYSSSALMSPTTYSLFPVAGAPAAAPRLATLGLTYGSANILLVFYEQAPSGIAILSSINFEVVNLSGGNVAMGTWSTGTNISGQPFVQGSNLYLPVVYPSQVQQTLFLTYQALGTTPIGLAQVAGRYFSSNDAGAAPTNFRTPQSFVTSTGQSLPVVVQPQGTSASSVSASLSELSLSFSVAMNSAQLGGDQHLALGSMMMDYDGTNLVEHNFHLFPETLSISYLTSQLTVITDYYDPTDAGPGSQFTTRIAIPDNAASPGGPVGQLITPGEYITFSAASSNPIGASSSVVYFTVNGVGTAPTGIGTGAVPFNITSNMTAIQIATALYAFLQASYSATYLISYTPISQTNVAQPQYIYVSNDQLIAAGFFPPVLNRVSTATQVYIGNGVAKAIAGISTPPANLISSGQYGSFGAMNSNGTAAVVQTYFWFNNSANQTVGNETLVATDPMPFGMLAGSGTANGYPVTYGSYASGGFQYIGIEVTLAAGDTAQAVAAKVVLALTALQTGPYVGGILSDPYNGAFISTQHGNVVEIQSPTSGAFPIIQPANYPTTTIGQGYVGTVVNNSNQPYAEINYSAVREWIDSQNQLHQSAPSEPATAYIPTYQATGLPATLPANASNIIPAGSAVPVSAVVQLGVQPLSLTLKTAALTGTELDTAIYRTISGATVGNQIYYRITPSTSPLFNQPTSTIAIAYADYSGDGESSTATGTTATGVQANQLLYTTGGVQPNAAPPACSYVLNHQNRLWLTGLENPDELWYSETWESGFAVNFTSAQQVLLNPIVGAAVGGPIVALASMDSYLIVFQENQIWYIQGYGPDPTGGNGLFSPPQIVASSSQIGCRDPQSVVLMPNGVMFKSTQGFWLLGRDLQLRYVGAAVKGYNADVVTSSAALANNSQINFLSNSGTTLMYDWYYDSWATFTTNGLDSVLDATGTFNMITSSGAIWYQVNGQYIDGDGSPVLMGITTAWLKPQNVQGFQRIWRILLEGLFYGSQQYNVTIAYNYGAIVDNFPVFVGAGGAQVGVWGQSATWGEFPWGEDAGSATTYANQIQLRIDNSNQLCESLQLSISDLPPVPVNQTWSLNALDLVLGVRSGGFKRIGPPQSVG